MSFSALAGALKHIITVSLGCWVKTTPRGNFSHPKQICDANSYPDPWLMGSAERIGQDLNDQCYCHRENLYQMKGTMVRIDWAVHCKNWYHLHFG